MTFTIKCHKSVKTKDNSFIPNTWSQGTDSDVLHHTKKDPGTTISRLSYNHAEQIQGTEVHIWSKVVRGSNSLTVDGTIFFSLNYLIIIFFKIIAIAAS